MIWSHWELCKFADCKWVLHFKEAKKKKMVLFWASFNTYIDWKLTSSTLTHEDTNTPATPQHVCTLRISHKIICSFSMMISILDCWHEFYFSTCHGQFILNFHRNCPTTVTTQSPFTIIVHILHENWNPLCIVPLAFSK